VSVARTVLAVQTVDADGLNATYTTVPGTGSGNGFTVTADDDHRTFLHVRNDNAGTLVVTVLVNKTDDGLTVPDVSVASILTTERRFIALRRNNRQADNLFYIDFDTATSVTVAALKVTLA
jgi:hypothetical protein